MVANALNFLPGTGRGTVRRTVEGLPPCADMPHLFHRRRNIIKRAPRGYTNDLDALCGQPCVAIRIAVRPVAHIVRDAVDLNRHASLGTEEVEHITSSRMVAAKLESARTCPQRAPQQAFGQAQLAAQSPCTFDRFSWSAQHGAHPSTALRAVPLPVPGRNYIGNGASI